MVTRNNKLHDTLAETCRRAHLSVKVKAGSNLTKDHSHTRPADILVPNWSLGKPAALDLSVMSPLNSNVLLEAGLAAGQAARDENTRKMIPDARSLCPHGGRGIWCLGDRSNGVFVTSGLSPCDQFQQG